MTTHIRTSAKWTYACGLYSPPAEGTFGESESGASSYSEWAKSTEHCEQCAQSPAFRMFGSTR